MISSFLNGLTIKPGHARDKAKSNRQIPHLERIVPSASTVASLVISGSSRPRRNFPSNTPTDKTSGARWPRWTGSSGGQPPQLFSASRWSLP